MRQGALVAGIVYFISACHPGAAGSPLDPVALCDSVQVDSQWQPIGIGDSLAVLLPWSAQHPRTSDAIGPIPWTQQWVDGSLTVAWETVPIRFTDRDPFDSLPGSSDYSVPASPDCSAPAPKGWRTHTFIWRGADGGSLIARTFIWPSAPRQWALDLIVVASRPAEYARAIAVLKSLRAQHVLPSN